MRMASVGGGAHGLCIPFKGKRKSKLGMNGKQAGSTARFKQEGEFLFIEVILWCHLKREILSFGAKETLDEVFADWAAESIRRFGRSRRGRISRPGGVCA